MEKIFLLVVLLSVFAGRSSAQISEGQIDLMDFSKLKLPSLETLFENAKKSPNVEMYEARMDMHDNLLLSEKRSWLKYFRVGSYYQYGNFAINSVFTNEFTPLFHQSSGANQSSWYSTAGINIPLDDLFDRKNRVKRQKMEHRFTELEMEKWLDEQKMRIVNSYVKANSAISTLKRKVEAHNIAEANYRQIENEFKLGNATLGDLSTAKKLESEAFEVVKFNEAQITSEILLLEILSKTNIISP